MRNKTVRLARLRDLKEQVESVNALIEIGYDTLMNVGPYDISLEESETDFKYWMNIDSDAREQQQKEGGQ